MNYTRRYVAIMIGLLLVGGVFLPLTSQAQSTPQEAAQINTNDIAFTAVPEVPGPFQNVTITAESYLTNVSRAYFVWKVDGKTVLSQTGAYRFTFSTKDIGERTTVSLMILLVSGETIQKNFVFNPAEINIVWEGADSYVPPFYRGRALPSSEGIIRVLAIPQINNGAGTLDGSKYVFRWKKNDSVLSNNSGYNKNVLLFAQDYLNPNETIEVTGQDNLSGSTALGTATISVFDPKILMYVRDPINGVDWNHEIGNSYDVTTVEKTILAIPYFFTPFNPISNQLKYEWTINGDEVRTPLSPNMLTLKSGTTKGISNLKLRIENTVKLFLDAEKSLTINLK